MKNIELNGVKAVIRGKAGLLVWWDLLRNVYERVEGLEELEKKSGVRFRVSVYDVLSLIRKVDERVVCGEKKEVVDGKEVVKRWYGLYKVVKRDDKIEQDRAVLVVYHHNGEVSGRKERIEEYEDALRKGLMPGWRIGEGIKSFIDKRFGCLIRKRGGLYFIPQTFADEFREFAEGLGRVFGGGVKVGMVEVIPSAEVVKEIVRVVSEEILSEVKKIEEEVELAEKWTGRKIESVRKRIERILKKIELYEKDVSELGIEVKKKVEEVTERVRKIRREVD